MALIPNDPSYDNGPGLTRKLREGQRVAFIQPGRYHFHTAPDLNLDSFSLLGMGGPCHTAYQTGSDKHSPLVFEWHGNGTFFDIPINLPYTRANKRGPFVIKDIFFKSENESSSLLKIGNENDTDRKGAQSEGIHINGCSFYLKNQNWHSHWFPSRSLCLPDGKINRTTPRTFCIQIWKPYALVIADCDLYGGFIGLDLRQADRPEIRRVNCRSQAINAKHKSYKGCHAVPGNWSMMLEGHEGIGLWSDSSLCSNLRIETGYDRPSLGQKETPLDGWEIVAKSNHVNVEGIDARDYFEPDFPFRIVTDEGKSFWLLADTVTSTNIKFHNYKHQCRFLSNIQGSKIYRYFGMNFVVKGHRAELGGCQSWGQNKSIPNLPIGFFALGYGRMKASGGTAGRGNFDKTNRAQIIGHDEGIPHPDAEPGLDYFGGSRIFMPVSPFVNLYK
jgi:hypothetical protein